MSHDTQSVQFLVVVIVFLCRIENKIKSACERKAWTGVRESVWVTVSMCFCKTERERERDK